MQVSLKASLPDSLELSLEVSLKISLKAKLKVSMKVSLKVNESMSQSANPPTSQIGIRCSRAKKCSEGALKVLYEMMLYVGGWGIFCFAELWFSETLNSRDTEQPRQRLDESKPSGGRYWKCVNFYS